jgi:hypothetical protein
MIQDDTYTRRAFLKGGAAIAAPVAAVAPAIALAQNGLHARVQRLEDDAAIRELHHSWLREVNAGEREVLLGHVVRRIIADHAGAPDRVEIAADGQSAVGYFDCVIETEAPLAEDCTLVQMANAQGSGALHRTERRTLTIDYSKIRGDWKIVKIA